MKNNVDLRSTEIALRERVKELACLYGISELAQQDNLSVDQILKDILKLIPPAWQYPEYTVARIVLDNHFFISDNFYESDVSQAEEILINGQQRGKIEVFYLNELPKADEGPFLKEERKLIQAIARKIALIIERREALEEKQKLYEQIRHADRLATIGEFTAGIAHEINEPLGNILGYAQLAIKSDDLPKQVAHDLGKIINASLNAREIIKKLMYFSHQIPQRFAEVNLNHIIKEAMYFLESQCSKENIDVVYHLTAKRPIIIADPIQLNQVIVNLVVNSIQAMPEGGRLTLSTLNDRESVILKVEDTGTGIPEDIRPHIFKPFFTTKELNKGTGLGLSVVHGIVDTHKGQIKVESQKDKGTIFEINFPLKNSNI